MKLLMPYLKLHWATLGTAILLAVGGALLELLPHGIVYAAALDVFASPPRTDRLLLWAGLAMGGVVVRFLLLGGSLVLSHKVAFQVLRSLREALVQRLAASPAQARDGHSPASLKKVLVEDVDGLENLFAHNLVDLASGFLVPILAWIVLIQVDSRLALASVALVPVAFLSMAFTMRDMNQQFVDWHGAEARANSSILEYLRGIAVLKAHDADASSLARVRGAVEGVANLAVTMTKQSSIGYTLFSSFLQNNMVVILPIGVWLHQTGAIDTPALVLFIVLGFGLTAPLLKLLFLFGNLQHSTVRIQRVQDVLDLPFEPLRPAVDVASAKLSVRGLSFAYEDARGHVLNDVTFDAEPGTVTAIVGPSGSGKSTLLQLLAGIRLPEEGEIELGGISTRSLSAVDRDRHITSLAQHAWLFRGSLRDNLTLGMADVSATALEQAVDAARLRAVVEGLEGGLDGLVGERGATLSGGEAQRVAIARAFLRDRKVLLLDEVTAHLDPENERAVQEALARLVPGRTVVVVAHRLRTVQDADQILVLDAGRVVGKGTHASLQAGCPVYARLWASQERSQVWRIGAEVAS
ncbi:MAG: ABC transporter ATP-binding protein [Myxococcota bacterium]